LYKSLKLCMCTPIGLDPRIENWLFNFPINVSGPHKERQSLVMNHVVSMPGEVEWLNGCVYASNSILSFTVWDCCSWCYRFHPCSIKLYLFLAGTHTHTQRHRHLQSSLFLEKHTHKCLVLSHSQQITPVLCLYKDKKKRFF